MKIELNIKDHWIESGSEPRRVMTLEEYLEYECVCCLEVMGEVEIETDYWTKGEENILVCKKCASIILTNKLEDCYDFKVFML